MKSYIKQCPICQIKINFQCINVPERPIIDKSPHYVYQMDCFYLDEDIVENTDHKHITTIIDHFSKWIWSYALKTKTGREYLLSLINYTYAFGISNKLIPIMVWNLKIFILICFVQIIILNINFQNHITQKLQVA